MHDALVAHRVSFVETNRNVDITEADEVIRFAQEKRFSHILNCAAYTQVDAAESNAALALRVNGEGPANLWAAAQAVGGTLLHVSTDYVFDGRSGVPYRESDEPYPVNSYGRSKLAGEQAVLTPAVGDARAFVVRTSWLFAEYGKNFVLTMLRLMRERTRLRVVNDQLGRPTYAPDLANACLELVGITGKEHSPGLFHYANSEKATWYEFADAILHCAQAHGAALLTTEIEPIATSEYPTPAARPSYSVLDTARFTGVLGQEPRSWRAALEDCVSRALSAGR
jgi:dTDP-4-dehydrorhamnose reductase